MIFTTFVLGFNDHNLDASCQLSFLTKCADSPRNTFCGIVSVKILKYIFEYFGIR